MGRTRPKTAARLRTLKVRSRLAAPALGLIRPSSVAVVDGYIQYEWMAFGTNRVSPPSSLLSEFMALSEGPEAAIQAFVEHYGGLGLCPKHNRPFFHPPAMTLGSAVEQMRAGGAIACDPAFVVRHSSRRAMFSTRESINGWRSWASRFRVLHSQIVLLKRSQPTNARLDAHFFRGETEVVSDRAVTTVRDEWAAVSQILNAWMYDARVTPCVSPTTGGDLDVAMGASGEYPLFGELTLQLFKSVVGPHTWEQCDGCGKAFLPERKRADSRHKFCRECGVKASWRLSKQRRRREQRIPKAREEAHRSRSRRTLAID
jgi:hypothetical protein